MGFRFRWPFVRRRRLDNMIAAFNSATDYVADQRNKVRALEAEVIRLRREIAEQERAYRVDARIKMLEAELADVERARDAARADVETLRKVAFSNDKHVARLKRRLARIKEALEATTFIEDAQ